MQICVSSKEGELEKVIDCVCLSAYMYAMMSAYLYVHNTRCACVYVCVYRVTNWLSVCTCVAASDCMCVWQLAGLQLRLVG